MEPLKSYNRATDGELEAIEQVRMYYRILSREDSGSYLFHCHGKKVVDEETGKVKTPFSGYCCRKGLPDFEEQYNKYLEGWNGYVTLNLFTGKYRYNTGKHKWGYFRENEDVIAINAHIVDIDIMKNKSKNPDISYTVEEGDRVIEETVLPKLRELYESGKIKWPTMIVYSGRGIQMVYMYKEPIDAGNAVERYKHTKLFSHITTYLQSYFDKDYAEIDTAVKDAARVCRLPGTIHQGNGRMAVLQEYNAENYYSVDELVEFYGVDVASEESKRKTKKEKKAGKVLKLSKPAPVHSYAVNPMYPAKKSSGRVVDFAEKVKEKRNLLGKVAAIEELAEQRGMSEGDYREVMLHIYYSLHRQLHNAPDAAEKLYDFNETFDEPLSDKDLECIIRSTDHHKGRLVPLVREVEGELVETRHKYPDGYYETSREGIIKLLCMSEEEIAITGILKRQYEKERADRNRNTRNEVISRAIEMLKRKESVPAIASMIMQEAGKSRATAYRWIEKAQKQVSEELEKKNAQVEEILSHFSVNRNEEYMERDTKGALLVVSESSRVDERGRTSLTRVYEDGLYVYTYTKTESISGEYRYVQEFYRKYMPENSLFGEENDYHLLKMRSGRYTLAGELIKQTEGCWKLCGIRGIVGGIRVG